MYCTDSLGDGRLRILLGKAPFVHFITTGLLTRRKVYNHKNELLGDVIELMLNIQNGAIGYVPLSISNQFGLGKKLLAVPWKALTINIQAQRVILAAEKDHLKNAPGFYKNDWPNTSNPHWIRQIHIHYGIKSN